MGLFDTICCKKQLPDNAPDFVKECPVFQTYDLGRGMGEYTITEDGRLLMDSNLTTWMIREALGCKEFPPVPLEYKRKRIEMRADNLRGGAPRGKRYVYFTDDGGDYTEVVYVVQIRDGKVSSIKEKFRQCQPAQPIANMNRRCEVVK